METASFTSKTPTLRLGGVVQPTPDHSTETPMLVVGVNHTIICPHTISASYGVEPRNIVRKNILFRAPKCQDITMRFIVVMVISVPKGLIHFVTNGGAKVTKDGTMTAIWVHHLKVVPNPITICLLTTLVIFGVERLKRFVSKCSRHDKDSLD